MVEGTDKRTTEEKETRKRTWRRGSQARGGWRSRLWKRTGLGDKTLWDLLQLLIVPLALTAIGLWFTAQQDRHQQQIEEDRATRERAAEDRRTEVDRQIEEQRADDAALQAYLDQMSTLLLEKDLRFSTEDNATEDSKEARTLARARTLTVLARLDPSRKTQVLQFLVEAELVQEVDERSLVISLNGADLNGADLSFADLNGANLSVTDLNGADLSSANLNRTNLTGADLNGADLSHAYMFTDRGWPPDEGELEQAESLESTITPYGTVHAGHYVTEEFEHALSFSVGDNWVFAPETYHNVSIAYIEELEGERQLGGELIFTSPPGDVFDPSKPSEQTMLSAPQDADDSCVVDFGYSEVCEWVSWFQSHPNLQTSEPVPVSVGGASGMRIDVTPSSTPQNYPRHVCGEQPCVPLFRSGDSEIVSHVEWKDRFVIVEVEYGLVIIDVAAPIDKFDELLPKAQNVLDTVKWKST